MFKQSHWNKYLKPPNVGHLPAPDNPQPNQYIYTYTHIITYITIATMNKNIPRTSIKSKTRFNPRWNTAIGRFEEMAGLVLFLFRCSDLCSQHLTNTGENSPRNVDDSPFKHQPVMFSSYEFPSQLSYFVRSFWSKLAGLGVDLDLLFPFLHMRSMRSMICEWILSAKKKALPSSVHSEPETGQLSSMLIWSCCFRFSRLYLALSFS